MLILLMVSIAVVLLVLHAYLPWASRLFTLYVLHRLRDRLYEIGDRPHVRAQLLYRDVEYLLCLAIHQVRAGRVDEVLRILRASAEPQPGTASVYTRSAEALGDDLDRIMALLAPCAIVMVLHVMFSRPAFLVLSVVVVPMLLVIAIVRGFFTGPLMRVAQAVDEATRTSGGLTRAYG